MDKSTFTPILRTRYSPTNTDYIELHFEDYAIPLPRSKLEEFPSLGSMCSADTGRRTIPIPNPKDTEFFAFYSYIFKKDYHPELPSITSPYSVSINESGPPVIGTYGPSESPYLAIDIRVFIFASIISFAELRMKARDRLYAMKVVNSDPVEALTEVYSNNGMTNEQDITTLRTWVREFLAKEHPISKVTNLAVLKTEQWADKFIALQKSNSDLVEDCRAVQETLLLKKTLGIIDHGNDIVRYHKGDANSVPNNRERDSVLARDNICTRGISNGHETGLLQFAMLEASAGVSSFAQLPGPVHALTILSAEELQMLREISPEISNQYERLIGECLDNTERGINDQTRDEEKDTNKSGNDTKGKGKEKKRQKKLYHNNGNQTEALPPCAHHGPYCWRYNMDFDDEEYYYCHQFYGDQSTPSLSPSPTPPLIPRYTYDSDTSSSNRRCYQSHDPRYIPRSFYRDKFGN